jgi:hypothetical protein
MPIARRPISSWVIDVVRMVAKGPRWIAGTRPSLRKGRSHSEFHTRISTAKRFLAPKRDGRPQFRSAPGHYPLTSISFRPRTPPSASTASLRSASLATSPTPRPIGMSCANPSPSPRTGGTRGRLRSRKFSAMISGATTNRRELPLHTGPSRKASHSWCRRTPRAYPAQSPETSRRGSTPRMGLDSSRVLIPGSSPIGKEGDGSTGAPRPFR